MSYALSHWSEALPLKTQEATEVANLLYKENGTRYGAPRTLACDRGKNFMSKIVQILCKMFRLPDMSQVHNYHLQRNVAFGRLNSTLAQSLHDYWQNNQTK